MDNVGEENILVFLNLGSLVADNVGPLLTLVTEDIRSSNRAGNGVIVCSPLTLGVDGVCDVVAATRISANMPDNGLELEVSLLTLVHAGHELGKRGSLTKGYLVLDLLVLPPPVLGVLGNEALQVVQAESHFKDNTDSHKAKLVTP